MRFLHLFSVFKNNIMNANAAARKRRAGGASFEPAPPTPAPQQQQNQQNKGLTIQQVVVLVDQRLTTLETFMRETKESNARQVPPTPVSNGLDEEIVNQLTGEMNQRFELLATELGELKDIVMKLQSYTMDVNRTLLEQKSVVPVSEPVSSTLNFSSPPTFDYSTVYVGGSDLNLHHE